jgi:hypothetical protein
MGIPMRVGWRPNPNSSVSLVTRGLVLNLDTGTNTSYAGSGTSWSDLSGNGLNATLVNGVIYSPANSGNLIFDGVNDYVQVPYTSMLAPTSQISFGGWAYLADWNVTTDIRFLSKTQGGGYSMCLNEGTTGLSGFVGANILIGGSYRIVKYSRTLMSAGWHHLFATFDGTQFKLYIDGILVDTYTHPTTASISYSFNNILAIGAEPDGTTNITGAYLPGRIAMINIYDTALTETEVIQNYDATKARFTSNINKILDTYSGSLAAYSLRKIRSAYTGSAITVRRSSDNTSTNIGFDSSGNLDTTTLLSFVGSGTGFVSVWFDQSGNGYNLVQDTSVRQPVIVLSGVLYTLNNKPAIFHSELNIAKFLKASFGSTFTGVMSAINVGSNLATTGGTFLWSGSNSPFYCYSYNTTWLRIGASAEMALTGTIQNLETQRVINAIYNAATSRLRLNNGAYASGNTGTVSIAGLTLGASHTNSTGSRAYHQEFIVWNMNQLSEMTNINNSINTYYSIY